MLIHALTEFHRSCRRLCRPGLILALAATLSAGLVLAQQDDRPAGNDDNSRIGDKRLGEEQQIRQRSEWFFSTRRSAAGSELDLRALRLAGVEQTRQALEAQRLRRSRGLESTQNFWVPKGPAPSRFGNWAFGDVSGRIMSIAKDWNGNALYVGAASGGVWKSTNDGLSWISLFDSAGTVAAGAVAVDPTDPDVLWVGTGDNVFGCEDYFGIGMLRSTDGGATWEPRNGDGGLDDLSSFSNVLVDPRDPGHIVTGGRIRGCTSGSEQAGGIYTTDDGGLTWVNRLSGREVHEIAQDPTVLNTYWAGTADGIFKSVDNAITWTLQTASGLPAGAVGRAELAISPSASNTVYALFSGGPSFWRTTNGGASWTQQSSGTNACDGQCWYNMALRVHNSDPDVVYRGTVHIFKSLNGGASWSDLSNAWGSSQKVHQDMHALLMDPTDDDAFYVAGDGGIWKSENGGGTFSNLNGNLNITQFYAVGVDANDPERICGGAQDNSSLARTNDNHWDRQAVTGDGFICQIDPQSPNYTYITSYPSGGYPSVWRSTTGLFGNFNSVTGAGSGLVGGDRISWVTPYTLDPQDPSVLYLGTHRMYRSVNRGNSWSQLGPDLTGGSGSLAVLEVNRTTPTHLFSGSGSGRVYRSVDGGTNWTNITSGLPPRSINDVAADPTNPDRAFAVVGGFNTSHLWEWNAGTGWTERQGGLPNVPANSVLMFNDLDMVVGTDTGVFRSQDGGVNFTPYMNGLPIGLVVTDLKYVEGPNVLTAGTYGRGAWQVTVAPPQPILVIDSIEQPMLELDGDGDGKIEPGETWSVRPLIKNAGGEVALDASARLVSPTPGVTILDSAVGQYGTIVAGASAAVATAHLFTVDPSFACGAEIVFDLLDLTSSNAPVSHGDQLGVLRTPVLGAYGSPPVAALLDEDFDPSPTAGWSHEAVDVVLAGCGTAPILDEWNVATKDAAHGQSYHCGNGPTGHYSRSDHAWLYPVGKDSEGGPGISIPAEAVAATLTLVHWYSTASGIDGGQLAIDGNENGQDLFLTASPIGGYPPGTLAFGRCNALEGEPAFHGSSGGWITSVFDLTSYVGKRIYPAFAFGTDRSAATGEGWYIDQALVEYQLQGPPLCDIARWPGEVGVAHFDLLEPGTILASWDDSCNIAEMAGQTYSIQVGDLDALTVGDYTHVPLGGLCIRTSSSTFSPGAGNEYYLVVPSGDGREGGAGVDSSNNPRPQQSTVCGQRRVDCP